MQFPGPGEALCVAAGHAEHAPELPVYPALHTQAAIAVLSYGEFELSGQRTQEGQAPDTARLPLPHPPYAPLTHLHEVLSWLSENRLHMHADAVDVHGVHMPVAASSMNPAPHTHCVIPVLPAQESDLCGQTEQVFGTVHADAVGVMSKGPITLLRSSVTSPPVKSLLKSCSSTHAFVSSVWVSNVHEIGSRYSCWSEVTHSYSLTTAAVHNSNTIALGP